MLLKILYHCKLDSLMNSEPVIEGQCDCVSEITALQTVPHDDVFNAFITSPTALVRITSWILR